MPKKEKAMILQSIQIQIRVAAKPGVIQPPGE